MDLPAEPRNPETENAINGKIIECKTNKYTSVISISVLNMLFNKPGFINKMSFDFTEKRR
ncbi:MAG: hypothetical protein L6V88_06775 [Anaerotruncus sp.]|nr:MAG: hypothetical protein L6V88_06775 [Anaerotruncus sp.]